MRALLLLGLWLGVAQAAIVDPPHTMSNGTYIFRDGIALPTGAGSVGYCWTLVSPTTGEGSWQACASGGGGGSPGGGVGDVQLNGGSGTFAGSAALNFTAGVLFLTGTQISIGNFILTGAQTLTGDLTQTGNQSVTGSVAIDVSATGKKVSIKGSNFPNVSTGDKMPSIKYTDSAATAGVGEIGCIDDLDTGNFAGRCQVYVHRGSANDWPTDRKLRLDIADTKLEAYGASDALMLRVKDDYLVNRTNLWDGGWGWGWMTAPRFSLRHNTAAYGEMAGMTAVGETQDLYGAMEPGRFFAFHGDNESEPMFTYLGYSIGRYNALNRGVPPWLVLSTHSFGDEAWQRPAQLFSTEGTKNPFAVYRSHTPTIKDPDRFSTTEMLTIDTPVNCDVTARSLCIQPSKWYNLTCTAPEQLREYPWNGTTGGCDGALCTSRANEGCGPGTSEAAGSNGLIPGKRYFVVYDFEDVDQDLGGGPMTTLRRSSVVDFPAETPSCPQCYNQALRTMPSREAHFDVPTPDPTGRGFKALVHFPKVCWAGSTPNQSPKRCAGSVTTCTTNNDCPSTSWCMGVDGQHAPAKKICTSNADCGSGGLCDTAPPGVDYINVYMSTAQDLTDTTSDTLFTRILHVPAACAANAACDGGGSSCVSGRCVQSWLRFPDTWLEAGQPQYMNDNSLSYAEVNQGQPLAAGVQTKRTTGDGGNFAAYSSSAALPARYSFNPFDLPGGAGGIEMDDDGNTGGIMSFDLHGRTGSDDYPTGKLVPLQLVPTVVASIADVSIPVPHRLKIGSGAVLTGSLSNTATINFAAIDGGTCATSNVTLSTAVVSDAVTLGIPDAAENQAESMFNAWVSATSTVTVKHCCTRFPTAACTGSGTPAACCTGSAAGCQCDPGSGLFRVDVMQH